MGRARWVWLGVGLALAGMGCDLDRWLEARGTRSFREIGLAEAQHWIRERQAIWVQPEEPSWGRGSRLPGAVAIRSEKPLPPAVIQATGPILVVAHEPQAARRLAARIARAGPRPVAVVRGGVEAWRASAPAATAAQPDDGGVSTTW